jgi:hypothetical protein
MLLSAMHAPHSESTARIAHISGAIVRFATLHGFNRIIDLGDGEVDKILSPGHVLMCELRLSQTISAYPLPLPLPLP